MTSEVYAKELYQAVEQYGFKYNSTHEFYGVLIEEIAEVFEEIRKKKHDFDNLETEIKQVMAVCHKGLITVDILRDRETEIKGDD